MKNIIFFFLLSPLFILSQNTQKVLLIGVDGCRPDALSAANTPNMDALINNSVFSPDALNSDITISGPGWSAILCGIWSDKHLVTGNDFSVNDYLNYPPVFKHIEEYNDNLNTASICHWGPINDYIVQNFADYILNVSSDADAAAYSSIYISNDDPDFIFVHFDEVDVTGHSYGFSPSVPEYINIIENTDVYIGNIIQAITQRPNYLNEDWLILITTDHGGIGTSHGGNNIEEKNVFIIASNENISPSVVYKDSLYVFDGAVNCIGDSVELKFDGTDDFVQIPNNSMFNFGTNQDFTIECRVRTNTGGDVAIIGNKDWYSGNNKGFVFSFKYPAGPEWKVNIGDGANRADLETGGNITDNEWYTLSVSFDRDGLMKMFEDGILIDSTDISFVGDITTNSGLFFGTDINQDYDYNGSISEVRVWNNIIDDQIIQSWYCSSVDPSHPNYNNLIGYWKLNEGNGNSALDYLGGFGIPNGTINNASWHAADSVWIDDYNSTPRLVDVPISILNHLCIPIDNNWGLEGISLVPDCFNSNVEENENLYKNIIDINNILGGKTLKKHNSPLLYFYDDGTIEKKVIID